MIDLGKPEVSQARRIKRLDWVDSQPAEIRKLVHDYGFNVVWSMMSIGVVKPKHIRHIVETVLNEFSPTRGSFSRQGVTTPLNQVEQP